MHRFAQLLAVVAAAATPVAAADPIVTSLFLPLNDPQEFVATVLNVDGSATTYAVTCASDVETQDCGMNTHATIVQGPSTWQMSLSQSDEEGMIAVTAACALTPSRNVASCTISETESDSSTQTSNTSTGATTSYSSDLQAVTLISGLDKLTGGMPTPSSAASTGSGASSSGPQSTAGPSQASSSGGAAASSSSSAAASSASGSKTGTPNAAPAPTQPALLAGVAAVVGALAL
ncbi:hypothetical protein V2A60_007443 [Cordyceps javanica]|uniref:GPI anchored glycoprotein n=1 Tax=Cordyceps javanica TaxID=43265 RepID=A0A545VB74_9HYPO|nr:GPI anchored glycoprotein [Cordyceps javanica]TQW01361.1 GPI anchored glycoprotein [Cordyceps javanica]